MPSQSMSVNQSRTIKRAMRILESLLQSEAVASNPCAVRDYLRTKIGSASREEFIALWLNHQNKIISCETLFLGTLSRCDIYPREVVRSALLNNAAAVIFAHNHPGGTAEPSKADIDLTESLRSVLATVDVRLLDHFVVTSGASISMAEMGAISHG